MGVIKKIGEIKETVGLRVSARGEGLYLYLPKALCERHDIVSRDTIKVALLDHYREVEGEEAE